MVEGEGLEQSLRRMKKAAGVGVGVGVGKEAQADQHPRIPLSGS